MSSDAIDAQFHRAVDIVQSLPKGGPVQTNYEEKLWLYSLYKQATEGDITIARPGLLDMLGRAKWDSWNKQKGVDKVSAKRFYVSALLKILRKIPGATLARAQIEELESYTGGSTVYIPRPGSPSSSTSSYHSSQASPPISPQPIQNPAFLPPPDHTLPAPDVASGIVPPSALTTSHRSLLSMSSPPPNETDADTPRVGPPVGSRTHSLAGGMTGRQESIHSLRMGRNNPHQTASALGFIPQQTQPRAFTAQTPQIRDCATPTPDISFSPYPGILHPTPIYPNRPPSTSTFSQAPMTVNLPFTLQQIQTSLTALHERLSTLERSQAMLLRREDRGRGWFGWGKGEADELDDMEDHVARARWMGRDVNLGTKVRHGKREGGMGLRVVWFLIASVRRAMLDVGVGMIIALVGVIILGGGWRKARVTLSRLLNEARRLITQS